MKTIPAGLLTHLSEEATTLATIWYVRRVDGTEYFLTDHDEDIVYDGDTYLSSQGYNRSSIKSDTSWGTDNMDLDGFFDESLISLTEIRAGALDFAFVEIAAINYKSPASGAVMLHTGTLGQVVTTSRGFSKVELRGMAQRLQQNVGELYSPECRADLGDNRCRIPIDPNDVARGEAYAVGDYIKVAGAGTGFEVYNNRIYRCTTAGTTDGSPVAYTTTVGASQVDGSAVFICEEAWMRHAVVASVTDQQNFTITVTEPRAVDGWYAYGVLQFDTGNNTGIKVEVFDWTQSGGEIETFLELPYEVQVGDKLHIQPGCDKRYETCKNRFNNLLNMRAEPFLPGIDAVLRYAEPK